MKTKLILATETNDTDYWTDLPFVPRVDEWFNVHDILLEGELETLKHQATCWSGEKGRVQSVEYHHSIDGYYVEIVIWCED